MSSNSQKFMNQGGNFKEMIMSMGMFSALNGGNQDDNSMFVLVIGMIMMQFLSFIERIIPIVISYINDQIRQYFKKKEKELLKKVEDNIHREKSGTITFLFIQEITNDKVNGIIHYMGSQNEALKLIFSNDYIVDNDKEFPLNFKDIKCKIISQEIEDGILRKMKFMIYSDILDLSALRNFVDDVEQEYINYKNNKLGNKVYYFNDISNSGLVMNNNRGYNIPTHKNIIFSMSRFSTHKSLDNLFGNEIKLINRRLDRFINNKQWYEDNGIPHTLGFLFHGIPGCGKTSTIKAIANDSGRHILNIKLSKNTTKTQLRNIFFSENIKVFDEDTNNVIKYIIPIDKRIYVFEEIDCMGEIIMDRAVKETLMDLENESDDEDKQKMTKTKDIIDLGFLLELFDGVLETPGRIMVMTTNHVKFIDQALMRPGRIDLKIEFGNCNYSTLNQMFQYFFGTDSDLEFSDEHSGFITPAMVSSIMIENMDEPEIAYNSILDKINYKKNSSP